jgi:hypothetical protein
MTMAGARRRDTVAGRVGFVLAVVGVAGVVVAALAPTR